MSFRDLIDRITGRPRGRHYAGRTRSRAMPTIQLPKSQPDPRETPARAIASAESRHAPASLPHSEPTPARAAIEASQAAPDAPTQYPQAALHNKDDVTAVLIAIDGDLKGEVFRLFAGENKLGRAEASDIVLSTKWISREHAMVVHQEGIFAIVPLTEKNRTYVNEREVDGAELSDGDTIRLGHTTFRFRSVEGL